MSPHTNNWR